MCFCVLLGTGSNVVGPEDSSLHEERTRATRTSSGCSVVECFDIGSDPEQVEQESSSSSLWETTPRTMTKTSTLQPTITEHFIISSDVEDAQASSLAARRLGCHEASLSLRAK